MKVGAVNNVYSVTNYVEENASFRVNMDAPLYCKVYRITSLNGESLV